MQFKYMQSKYIHKDHPEGLGCGEIAFYVGNKKKHGDVLYAEEVIFPDGSRPKPRDPFKCGHCGATFAHPIIEYVEENK